MQPPIDYVWKDVSEQVRKEDHTGEKFFWREGEDVQERNWYQKEERGNL